MPKLSKIKTMKTWYNLKIQSTGKAGFHLITLYQTYLSDFKVPETEVMRAKTILPRKHT